MGTKWNVIWIAVMVGVLAAIGCDDSGDGGSPDGGDADLVDPAITMDNVAIYQGVSGTFGVEVTATDDVGVEAVELLVGGEVAASSSADPFTISWDTTATLDGVVSIVARAVDFAGNTAETAPIDVVVVNAGHAVEFTDGFSGAMAIPADYNGTQEVDEKHHWMATADGASRIIGIAFFTVEEGQSNWGVGLDVGSGYCPDSGEVLDSMETALDVSGPVVFDSQAEGGYPASVQMFFHLRPTNPGQHLGESLGYEFRVFSFD